MQEPVQLQHRMKLGKHGQNQEVRQESGTLADNWAAVGRVAVKAAWPGSNWVEKVGDWVKTLPRWLS